MIDISVLHFDIVYMSQVDKETGEVEEQGVDDEYQLEDLEVWDLYHRIIQNK